MNEYFNISSIFVYIFPGRQAGFPPPEVPPRERMGCSKAAGVYFTTLLMACSMWKTRWSIRQTALYSTQSDFREHFAFGSKPDIPFCFWRLKGPLGPTGFGSR